MRALLFVAVLVVACSGKKDKPKPGPTTNPSGSAISSPPKPARPPIVISASVNDQTEVEVARGEPLLLVVALVDEREKPLSTTVAADAIRIDVGGKPVAWPLHVVVPAASSAFVGATTFAWRLTPDEVSAIATGTYELVATLTVKDQSPRASVPVAIKIVERATTQPALAAREALWAGDAARAESLVDAALAKDKQDIVALVLKGDLRLAAGDKPGALDRYSAAVTAFYARNPKPQEPPSDIIRKRNKLMFELAKR